MSSRRKHSLIYRELIFVVSEAMEKLQKGSLSEEEYNEIILNVEEEMKKTQSDKNNNAFQNLFWKIIN